MGMYSNDTLHRYWGGGVGKERARDTSLSLVNGVLVETRKRIRNFLGE